MISRLLSYQIFSLADDGRLFGLDSQLMFDFFITGFNFILIAIIVAIIVIPILLIVYLIKKIK